MTTPTKITNAEQAVVAMKEGTYDPYALADYLKQSLFRTIVDPTVKTASVLTDYYAGVFNPGPGKIVSFQRTKPLNSDPFASLSVWFVPRVSVDRLVNNKNKFPSETLATIDLAKPQAPIICTEKLTGCCFVIGWDNKNGRLYLGHIEPSETKDRSYIAKYVRKEEVLPVPKNKLSKYICFGGDDDQLPSSYNNYTVNIIGLISSDRIWMAFQVLHPESGQQVRESMLMDFNRK